MAAKLAKGQFDMNDLRGQLAQMRRMGGLGALAVMIPGMKKAQAAMASGAVDDKILIHMDAMIGSMTHKERDKPALINAKRKIRIAKGSGTTVQEVNKLLKMHLEMSNAMKKIRKMGGLKGRSEEHTSELQSLMRNSYAVFCLKKQKKNQSKKERTQ